VVRDPGRGGSSVGRRTGRNDARRTFNLGKALVLDQRAGASEPFIRPNRATDSHRLVSVSTTGRRLLDPPVTRTNRCLHHAPFMGALTGTLTDHPRRVTGCRLGWRECRGSRGRKLPRLVQHTARDRVGAKMLKVIRIQSRVKVRSHPFRVSGL